jgi:hypothetical protein
VLLLTVLALAVGAQADDEDGSTGPVYPEPVILEQSVGPAGINTVVQIWPWQDAYIASGRPDDRFGHETALNLGYQAGGLEAMRILMRFNLSSIAPTSIINSATLEIYQFGSTPSNDSAMEFRGQYMTASWSENSVTWNNANGLGGTSLPAGSLSSSSGRKYGNMTSQVRAWHSGAQPNYGVIVTGDEGPERNRSRNFYSRQEPNSTLRPYLIVDFTASCDTVPPTATVEPLPSWSQEDFVVTWSGFDSAQSGCSPSGIDFYDVQYKRDTGSWVNWKTKTKENSATFEGGVSGSVYQFRARATDNAENVQPFGEPQAQTTVFAHAVSRVLPFSPLIITSSSPVTDSFEVKWEGLWAPGTSITQYDIWFQYNNGAWQLWHSFTGTPPPTSATFDYLDMGLGDGIYYFESVATNNLGQVEPQTGIKEAQVLVDLAGVFKPGMYFPIIVK